MARRFLVVISSAWLLAACSGPANLPTSSSATSSPRRTSATAITAPLCGKSDLAVSLEGGGLRAVNTSGHACALSGTHSVEVPWWRISGAAPVPAIGTLAPGAALVQAYPPVASNGCPPLGSGAEAPAELAVEVEGNGYAIPMLARNVHEIEVCDEVSAPRPRIVEAADSATSSVTTAFACDSRNLVVTVDPQLSIHVRNAGTSPCRLDGTPAVEMKVGRIDGAIPTTDVTLRPGQVFVQPQKRVAGASACSPMSAGLPRRGLWTIVVQDQTVHPATPNGQLVAQVVNCWVVTLPAGHVAS